MVVMEENREGEARIVWKVSLPDTREQETKSQWEGKGRMGKEGMSSKREWRLSSEGRIDGSISRLRLTSKTGSSDEVDGRIVES